MKSGNHLPNSATRARPRKLVRLHPREDSFEVSQGRTVLSTDLNGFIRRDSTDGLFVHQTRILSCYEWTIDGKPPLPTALSNVEQHSWLGYYIQSPRLKRQFQDRGSGEMAEASEYSLEFRLSRFIGHGMHEDVDLTNYTQENLDFRLRLELEADFSDQEETVRGREQRGKRTCKWQKIGEGVWELRFDYVAQHHYRHQGDEGNARIHRGIAIQVVNADSEPDIATV